MSFDLLQAPIVYVVILLNTIVAGYSFYLDDSAIDRGSLHVGRILRHGEYHRLLTSGFLHADLMHFLFNMMTLYFFGPYMEQLLGSLGFLALYFGAEVIANLFSLYVQRGNPSYTAIGASGAVTGVVFAFCLFEPLAGIYIFFVPVPVPAVIYAIAYTAYSMYAMRDQTFGGRVAHEAHLGGAIGGILMTLLLQPDALAIFLGHFSEFR